MGVMAPEQKAMEEPPNVKTTPSEEEEPGGEKMTGRRQSGLTEDPTTR